MAYNDYIVIQQRTDARDAYGEMDPTWSTYKSVWAEMDVPGGNLSYESDMPVYGDYRLYKIHTHDAPDVTTKHRIYDGTDYFYIRSIQKEGRLHTVLVGEAYDDE